MSNGMPELGSKISLISKADIRYEGRLYTVDPQECTIALSSVRSFGTEDRETQYKIAPQSQIYDYILFRGSDIKDIRVVNNSVPHPNDPAIMQMQLPNGQHVLPHFQVNPHTSVAASNYGNPFRGMSGLGALGANTASSAPNFPQSSNVASHYLLSQQSSQQAQQQLNQKSLLDHQNPPTVLSGVSRSTTPVSLTLRKSPTNDSAQANLQKGLQKQIHDQIQQINQNQTIENNHDVNARDTGYKRPSLRANAANQHNNARSGGNNDFYQLNRDRREPGRNAENITHQDPRQSYIFHRNQGGIYGGGGPNRNMWNMHRSGQNNQNFSKNRMLGNIGSGRNRTPHQNFRAIGIPLMNQNNQRNGKNPIKFDQDFDFEQANHKFEELRMQLTKLKVGEDSKTSEQANAEPEKKDDSGNETGAGEHEPEEEVTIGYDKTKSFFDNISCEAAQDRSKNKKNDWRQERKLNTETFGISSTRRGGFRARGPNFYNRNVPFNMNGGNGYNRNYRGNNYRNNRNYQTNEMGGNSNMPPMNNLNATAPAPTKNSVSNKNQKQIQPLNAHQEIAGATST